MKQYHYQYEIIRKKLLLIKATIKVQLRVTIQKQPKLQISPH